MKHCKLMRFYCEASRERPGTSSILSAHSQSLLCIALSSRGRFDEALEYGDAAVRIAEAVDHRCTTGCFTLGWVHLLRRDLPRANRFLERSLDLCRTWQFVDRTPHVAAALSVAYALIGRSDEALGLVADAVAQFHRGKVHLIPGFITILL